MVTSNNDGQNSRPRIPGRPSAKVLRRRRQVAAVLALVVLAALVIGGIKLAGFVGGLGSKDTNDAGAGQSSSASDGAGASQAPATPAAATAAPTAAATPVCDETGIKVTATTDKLSYAAGEDPKLTLRVSNSGTVGCSVDVGTGQMDYKITSSTDQIFSSKDCQINPTTLVKTLKPGESESANFTWKRNRSAQGCAKVSVTPGAGTYVYVATLGKRTSDKVVFTLK